MSVSLMKTPFSGARQRGAVLLVVAVIVALIGVLMILGVGSFRLSDNDDQILVTSKRQRFLMNELAAYVQNRNEVPCPADPSVNPSTVGFGVSKSPCAAGDRAGIVPFRTLNLSQDDALDGWGHYMTYAISPVLANTAGGAATDEIFVRCRRYAWFDGSPIAGPYNTFPQKARYCCPPSNGGFNNSTDLRVFASGADRAAGKTLENIGRVQDAAYYGPINTAYDGGGDPRGALTPIPAAAGPEDLFAVVIVSHGENAVGAYLGNGTAAQIQGTSSADEQENANGDRDFITKPISVSGNSTNDFDDIVIWKTQESLMSQLNNASCYMPWR